MGLLLVLVRAGVSGLQPRAGFLREQTRIGNVARDGEDYHFSQNYQFGIIFPQFPTWRNFSINASWQASKSDSD